MELENTQNNALAKLPMLKLREYEMWEIRIKQYFQIQDYAVWEVIENGNSRVPIPITTPLETGTSTTTKMTLPATIEENTCKKNDVKARSLLLMALPNEHQFTFDHLQKLVSRLAILGVVTPPEDLNNVSPAIKWAILLGNAQHLGVKNTEIESRLSSTERLVKIEDASGKRQMCAIDGQAIQSLCRTKALILIRLSHCVNAAYGSFGQLLLGVYNTRTRKVQENLHIGFLENKPMIEGNGPKWLFDIDSLTQSMNYVPVVAGTFSNNFAAQESVADAQIQDKDGVQDENDATEKSHEDSSLKDNDNTATPEDLVGPSPASEDTQSSVQTRRMKTSYSEQVFLSAIYEGKTHQDLHTCLFACFLSQEEPKRVSKALSDPAWVEAMQEGKCRCTVQLQKVWILMDLPKGHRAIVFAPVARIEAIRMFPSLCSLYGALWDLRQMDVKRCFSCNGQIKEEIFDVPYSIQADIVSCHEVMLLLVEEPMEAELLAKNYVLFTDSECLVLSPNFKLPDENQILLKIPRQDNMYSFDMKNIVPKDSLTCLVAKATSEESML
ncbi:hypothetical protein Tco_0270101 [Tanacetum coccineum]